MSKCNMKDVLTDPGVRPSVLYDDPNAAMEWLKRVFGFSEVFRVVDDADRVGHGELFTGWGAIMIQGTEFAEETKSPISNNGTMNQRVDVQVEDAQAHHDAVQAAGGEILFPVMKQFYGDLMYAARDLEGHVWTFRQRDRDVPPEEWDQDAMKAMGGLRYIGPDENG